MDGWIYKTCFNLAITLSPDSLFLSPSKEIRVSEGWHAWLQTAWCVYTFFFGQMQSLLQLWVAMRRIPIEIKLFPQNKMSFAVQVHKCAIYLHILYQVHIHVILSNLKNGTSIQVFVIKVEAGVRHSVKYYMGITFYIYKTSSQISKCPNIQRAKRTLCRDTA